MLCNTPILKDSAKFHGKYICNSSFWEVIEHAIFLIKDSKIAMFLRMPQAIEHLRTVVVIY